MLKSFKTVKAVTNLVDSEETVNVPTTIYFAVLSKQEDDGSISIYHRYWRDGIPALPDHVDVVYLLAFENPHQIHMSDNEYWDLICGHAGTEIWQ